MIGTLPSDISFNKILSHSVIGGNSIRGMSAVSIEVDNRVYLYASNAISGTNSITIRILCKK